MQDFNIWPRGGQAKSSDTSAAIAATLHLKKGTFDSSRMVIDWGDNTADALRQPDGSWKVAGKGSVDLICSWAISAERKARKVGFLPRQVERKIVRSVRVALSNKGHFVLGDGTFAHVRAD